MNVTKYKDLPIEACVLLFKEGLLSSLELGLLMIHRGLLKWPTISGQDIKDYRKAKRLTQDDLATLMNVSKMTLVRWETLEEVPSQVCAHFQLLRNLEQHLVKHMKASTEYLQDYQETEDFRYQDLPPSVSVKKISNLDFKPLAFFEPEDVRSLRKYFDMTQKAFANYFSVTQHQVMLWEKGKAKITPAYLKILQLLDQLRLIEEADIDPSLKAMLSMNIRNVLEGSPTERAM